MPPSTKKASSSKKKTKKQTEEEVLSSWAHKSDKIHGKAFAKKLPEATKKLREGQIHDDDLASDLMKKAMIRKLSESNCLDDGPKIHRKDKDDAVDPLIFIFEGLGKHAIPNDRHAALRKEFVFHMFMEFSKYMEANVWNEADKKKREKIAMRANEQPIQRVFDEVCHKFKAQIINECYEGKEELFRAQCTGYNASREQFHAAMIQLMRSADTSAGLFGEAAALQGNIAMAASQVERGVDKTKTNCWECGKEGGVQKCSSCVAARYCGRECQVKAWRGGHKKFCAELKNIFAEYEENMRSVDEALANPAAHENKYSFKPSLAFDYFLAELVTFNPRLFPTKLPHGVSSPSMKSFYENVSRVVAGRLWIYPEAVTGHPVEWKKCQADSKTAPDNRMMAVCEALSYDYSGTSNPSATMLQMHGPDFVKACHGKALPLPSEFLSIYLNTPVPIGAKALKLEATSKAYKTLIAGFHKHG